MAMFKNNNNFQFSLLKFSSTLTLILGCVITTIAQKKEKLSIKRTASSIIIASERFKPRPKALEFEFEVLNNFGVVSKSKALGDAESTVTQNLVRYFGFKIPIIIKKDVNLILGMGYTHEQFMFSKGIVSEYPLFSVFEDKPLKQLSSSLYFKKTLPNDRFLFGYINGSLNSDGIEFRKVSDQLKSSITVIKGKQISPNKQMGYGLSIGYDFGQPLVIPLFIYSNDFTLKWGLELLLPKKVSLRYSPTNKIHLYGQIGLNGASYHIKERLIEGVDKLEFRRSSARFSFRVEREIHDWLWIGATVGYRVPLNIFISEPGEGRKNSLVKIDVSNTLFSNLSIFIVPPKKLYNRAKGG
jgi:hypothetical protein